MARGRQSGPVQKESEEDRNCAASLSDADMTDIAAKLPTAEASREPGDQAEVAIRS